jgi:putative membrane protein
MRVFSLAGQEIRRFATPLTRAALLFLLAVPTLYGTIYLWTNWDPYGRLDQVPVAVVNEDRPVTSDGHKVDGGGMFVNQLKHTPLFDWRFVGRAEAERGQRDGRYYMVIKVPPNFSASLASGATDTPHRAVMDIQLDDANGYIIGKMAQTVQAELERQVSAAAVSAYAESAFGGLDSLADALTKAANGADALARGAQEAQTGATQLTSGLDELKAGSSRLAPGAREVADGVHQINAEVSPVLDEVTQDLPTVADSAADVSSLISQVIGSVATDDGSMRQVAEQANAAVDQLAADHPDIDFSALRQAQQQVLTATDDAAGLAQQAGTSAAAVADGIGALRRNVPALREQLETSAAELRALDSGAQQVADGAAALDTGIGEAQRGSARLAGGVGELRTGATDLGNGLHQVRERIPTLDAEQRSRAADVLSNPVAVTLHNLHPAGVYGRGLAPFFFGIALWVFGIVAFLLLRPVSARLLAGRTGAPTITFAAWLPVFGIGLAGGLLLFLVTEIGLGLRPINTLGTLGLVALAVAAFSAVVHLLRLAFGVVGDAIALVLLMIQLTSCGGLYPPETLPLPFQVLHPVLPMTHLVNGLRVTISGGDADHLWLAVAVLAGYLVVALALMVFVVDRRRTWSARTLHPELQL